MPDFNTIADVSTTLRDFIKKNYGAADILVNNAGVMLDPKGSNASEMSPDVLHNTMATNVYGPAMLCRALLPLLKDKGYGRIVNVSSDSRNGIAFLKLLS